MRAAVLDRGERDAIDAVGDRVVNRSGRVQRAGRETRDSGKDDDADPSQDAQAASANERDNADDRGRNQATEQKRRVAERETCNLIQHADIDLPPPGVAESITVQAATPTPLDSTDLVRNFSSDQIAQMPRRRNLIDTVALAAGVNQNGPNNAIMISGGMSYDNLFLIDGIVVGENSRGQPHNAFIEDAIQEVTVLTGSISAEYGRFTGGVVSAITKSGGNTFSGSLRDTMTNASWIADAPVEPAPHDDQTIHTYEGTLGGYALKDRLWFFGAVRHMNVTQEVLGLRSTGLTFFVPEFRAPITPGVLLWAAGINLCVAGVVLLATRTGEG